MNRFLRIFLLMVLVLPLWLTIVALAEEVSLESQVPQLDAWRNRINQELLSLEYPRIQVVEILDTTDISYLARSPEGARFKIDIPNLTSRLPARLNLRFQDEKGRLQELVSLNVRLNIMREVVISKIDLPRGGTVREEDVEVRWMDDSELQRNPARPSEIVGRQLRNYLPNGRVIYRSNIQAETWVTRGDRVQVRVVGGGVSILSMGVAQQNGSEGETIRILNPESKKEIHAVVTGPRMAEVKL